MIQPKGFPGLPEDWSSEAEYFSVPDDRYGEIKLFSQFHHKKSGGPRVLAVFHGLNEHGGRYLHLPHYLKNTVDGVYCLDHRGHGRSEGLRAHVDRFDQYCEDMTAAIMRLHAQLKSRYGKSEIHLLGHSMGGLITLRTLFLNTGLPVFSATVTAPLLGIKVKLNPIKRGAAQVLSRVWGNLHMATEIDARLLSHDPEVARAYDEDRLVSHKGTPRMYTELQAAIKDTTRRESGLDVPLQMIVAEADEIVDPAASLEFFKGLKESDIRLRTYPSFFHEVLNETEKEKPLADIASWIEEHR